MTRDDVGFEFMLNALRLTDGVPASLFAERTGYPLALVAQRARDVRRARACSSPIPRVLRPDRARPPLPERPAGALPAPTARRTRARTAPLVRIEATGVER